MYGRDHKQVKNLDEFVDGEKYICAGAEKLNLEASMSLVRFSFALSLLRFFHPFAFFLFFFGSVPLRSVNIYV